MCSNNDGVGHSSSQRQYEPRANMKSLSVSGTKHQKKSSSLLFRGGMPDFSDDRGIKS